MKNVSLNQNTAKWNSVVVNALKTSSLCFELNLVFLQCPFNDSTNDFRLIQFISIHMNFILWSCKMLFFFRRNDKCLIDFFGIVYSVSKIDLSVAIMHQMWYDSGEKLRWNMFYALSSFFSFFIFFPYFVSSSSLFVSPYEKMSKLRCCCRLRCKSIHHNSIGNNKFMNCH